MQGQPTPTIEYVESLTAPTKGFLCPLSANIYKIDFNHYKMRDIDSNTTLFQIKKEQSEQPNQTLTENQQRTIKYHFGPLFFELQTLGASLGFKVGNQPVRNLLMIEKHYFKQQLIKQFKFEIPFCIPNTQNSFEAIYDIPKFGEQKQQEMINSPWETTADSFYFVDGLLIIHTKAEFSYAPFEDQELI